MSNDYFNATGNPGTRAPGSSATMRTQFSDLEAAFDKLPDLTANAGKAVVVNPGSTGLTVTTGTLTLAGNFATSGASALTLTTTGATNVTLPTTGTLATLAGAETLSNKTLVAPALGTPASGVLTNCTGLPAAAVVAGALADGMTATTQSAGDSSTKLATTAGVLGEIALALPAGVVVPYAGSAAPAGWLLCFGQAVSRTTYAGLFTAIGTTYGVGDGSTTFNLPDLRGRMAAGKDDMGGAAASRLTSTTMSPDGVTLGATGGAQTAVSTLAVGVTGTASGTVAGATGTASSSGGVNSGGADLATSSATYSFSVGASLSVAGTASGSTNAAVNVPPTLILNYIIKVS